jgi:hypothetical protein
MVAAEKLPHPKPNAKENTPGRVGLKESFLD